MQNFGVANVTTNGRCAASEPAIEWRRSGRSGGRLVVMRAAGAVASVGFSERGGIRFIHVEVFTDNDPNRGYNRWMREWGLATEPWVFLVGADGRVKAKFEGSVSERELVAAVRANLL